MNYFSGIVAPLTAGGLALAAVAFGGCNFKGSGSTAGGPGATSDPASKPLYGEADNTFNLTASSLSVKQGDAATETIGIKRGTNFAQDVALKFENLPKGVTLEPTGAAIKSGAADAKFTLKVGDGAAPGDTTVNVVGHPGTGGDATVQFTLTVAKKDSFTLSMPFWTTGLKQGETKEVIISVSRDTRFDQPVTLQFANLPKGVTIEPASPVVKVGEPEVKVFIKAAADAALGSFSIMVTGHPPRGADATHEFKFNVAAK